MRFVQRWSLRGLLVAMAIVSLVATNVWLNYRLRATRTELTKLRSEVGYLHIDDEQRFAAARIPDDDPLTWRFRVYVPEQTRCRLAYTTRWLAGKATPDWYSYLAIPVGESQIIATIQTDPRDGLWKVSAMVRHDGTTVRSATFLPEEQIEVFRTPQQAISNAKVGTATVQTETTKPLRLLEDKLLVGEGGLVLYGARAPDSDTLGMFLEIQPDR